jgi:hypothetical protein
MVSVLVMFRYSRSPHVGFMGHVKQFVIKVIPVLLSHRCVEDVTVCHKRAAVFAPC